MKRSISLPIYVVLIAGLAWLLAMTSNPPPASAQQTRPAIKWVNPDLPEGPGLTHHILDSQALGHEVGYVVWTPPEYEQQSDKRFPVIYFLHGAGGTEAADSAGFSSLVSRAIREGVLPPSLVVFPNGGRSGYRGEVETMIVEELIPLIDREYRTKAEAASRAVAGFSMGGQGAVYLSLTHPNLFCAASSWGGGLRRGAEEVNAAVAEEKDTLQANEYGVILINGDQDRPESFTELAQQLAEHGVDHEVVIVEDTPHSLGRYYEVAGDRTMKFLADRLNQGTE